MTIDKAIEIHRGLKDIAEKHNIMIGAFYNTKEHEQIAEWLEELKRLQVEIAELQNERQADCAFMGEYEKYIRGETIDEVASKFKAYKSKQSDIKVGDVVYLEDDNPDEKGVVTIIDKVYDEVSILWFDGSCGDYSKENVKGTGEYVNIQQLLEQISGDKE